MAVAIHDATNLGQIAAVDAAGNVAVKVNPPTGLGYVFKTVKAQAITAGTPVAIWTPAAGKRFRLIGFMLSLTVAGSIIFEDATGAGNEFLRTPLESAGVGQASPNLGNGYLSSAANNALFADVTATGSISGFVFGTEE